jgi:hypothetical protein
VDQPGAGGRRLAGQDGGGLGVDAPGQGGLGLGAVDGGVGRSVDDDVGPERAHRPGERLRSGEVGPVAAERMQLAERREGALQLPADLAVLAKEQDLHPGTAPSRAASPGERAL